MSERQLRAIGLAFLVGLLCLVMILLLFVIVVAAHAAPPPWTTTLLRPETATTCGPCRQALTQFRDPTRWQRLSGWVVQINGHWRDVPPNAVVLTPRPPGAAVVCGEDGAIWCFVPPLRP